MAVNNVGKWSAQATVDASGFTTGTQKMHADAKNLESKLSGTFSNIKSNMAGLLTGNLVGLASGFIGAGMVASLNEYIRGGEKAIKQQDRLAELIGISSSQASSMIAIGKQAGQEPEQIQSDAIKALRHVGELRTELALGASGGAAAASLRALNIDPQQFANMGSFQNQLGLVADKLQKVTSAADRAAIMHGIFGRSSESLLPQMRLGSDGMDRMARYAEQLGVAVTGEAAESIRGINKDLREFQIVQGLAAQGLQNQMAVAFEEARAGASGYADATQRILDMQPEMIAGAQEIGRATGTLSRLWHTVYNEVAVDAAGVVNLVSDALSRLTTSDRERALQEQFNIPTPIGVGDSHPERDPAYRALLAAARAQIAENDSPLEMARNRELTEEVARILGEAPPPPPAASQAVVTAIGTATTNIERHNRDIGLTALEAQRADFVAQNASPIQLQQFDTANAQGILRQMNVQYRTLTETAGEAFERQIQGLGQITPALKEQLELTNTLIEATKEWAKIKAAQPAANAAAMSDFRKLQDSIIQLQYERDFVGLSAESFQQRMGRLLAAVPQMGPAPLLGSLSAGSSDAGAVLQNAISPQLDQLAAIAGGIENLLEQQRRTRELNERIVDALATEGSPLQVQLAG